jgi:hypothetical protein
MTAHIEPPVDGEEVNSHQDCVYTDGFTPSLPTLINRPPDTDAQSVSDVDSISTGETVSDAADDFDEISYDEIPALARRATGYQPEEVELSEQDMERVMMSDRTIVPDTPALTQRMPQLSPEPSTDLTAMLDHARITGLHLADKAFHVSALPSDRPLRLVYLGDSTVSNMGVALVISKIVGSMTGSEADKEAILDAASHAQSDGEILHSLAELPTPVQVDRAIGFNNRPGPDPLILVDGKGKVNLKELKPDLFILYRTGPAADLIPFAKKIAHHKIPMLELAHGILKAADGEDSSCVVPHTEQGDRCLRLSLLSSVEGEDEKTSNKEAPMSLSVFHALDDHVLSRHIACITNIPDITKKIEEVTPVAVKSRKLDLMSFLQSSLLQNVAQGFLALVLIFFAVGVPTYMLQQQSPASELAKRTPLLQAALNNSGLASVNASDVLHYPTSTVVLGNSTTTALAFPTSVKVHVIKSEHLLVSLPKAYWKSAQLGIFKSGKALDNFNNTRLIDGVISVSLPPSDAHGQVQISVLSTTSPLQNETVKVDLGNRLLQRVTYENAAKTVQHDVSGAHNAAKLAQAKVMSDVQSAFNQSMYSVHALGNSILRGMRTTGNAIGSASNHTTARISYMGKLTYNTSSTVGSFVKSAVPQKHHFVRARNNALKIRTRLLRRSPPTKQDLAVTDSASVSSWKSGFSQLQKQLSSRLVGLEKLVSRGEQSGKAPLKASTIKVTVKTSTVSPLKSEKIIISDAVTIKGEKQCKNNDKKLKSTCV